MGLRWSSVICCCAVEACCDVLCSAAQVAASCTHIAHVNLLTILAKRVGMAKRRPYP